MLNPLVDYILANPQQGFKPEPFYNRDGDMLEVYWKDSSCYAVQLTPKITLMKDQETDEDVGVKIHGISNLMMRLPWQLMIE